MCTAATYLTNNFYFGRTLDHDRSYDEAVTVTPRHFPLPFRHRDTLCQHHAFIGMAAVMEEYPLYYDGVNECGLSIAGLRFVPHAHYATPDPAQENITAFEFIPWVLGSFDSVAALRPVLATIRLVDTPFRENVPAAGLHWLIADRQEAITVESTRQGLSVYQNPVGVLANDPPFPQQLAGPWEGEPFSSPARFARAVYARRATRPGEGEREGVSAMFHILGAVARPRCGDGQHTLYTCCCNADRGIYYYNTYTTHQIHAVSLHRGDPEGTQLIRYPMPGGEAPRWQN